MKDIDERHRYERHMYERNRYERHTDRKRGRYRCEKHKEKKKKKAYFTNVGIALIDIHLKLL